MPRDQGGWSTRTLNYYADGSASRRAWRTVKSLRPFARERDTRLAVRRLAAAAQQGATLARARLSSPTWSLGHDTAPTCPRCPLPQSRGCKSTAGGLASLQSQDTAGPVCNMAASCPTVLPAGTSLRKVAPCNMLSAESTRAAASCCTASRRSGKRRQSTFACSRSSSYGCHLPDASDAERGSPPHDSAVRTSTIHTALGQHLNDTINACFEFCPARCRSMTTSHLGKGAALAKK